MRRTLRCPARNRELFRLFALDFPGSKGFVKEEQIVTATDDSPAEACIEHVETGDVEPW